MKEYVNNIENFFNNEIYFFNYSKKSIYLIIVKLRCFNYSYFCSISNF